MHTLDQVLFPAIEPNQTGMLKVDNLHTLYWETCGNPNGIPVIFLHGGPGAGISEMSRRFFNPEKYHIILFDQRGSGKSIPLGEYHQNTTQLLIEDIETIRKKFGIEKWVVFGGSWGSTLSLAYSQAHPENCLAVILRGIWLVSKEEQDWWMYGLRTFFPEVWDEFVRPIPEEERGDLMKAYAKRLFSDDPAISTPAAKNWSRYEGTCLHLLPRPDVADSFTTDAIAIGVGRLEAHYFTNNAFLKQNQLLDETVKIRHIPGFIVHGRYDMICPIKYAFDLHKVWPESKMVIIDDAGHSAYEPGIAKALVDAAEQFANDGKFS